MTKKEVYSPLPPRGLCFFILFTKSVKSHHPRIKLAGVLVERDLWEFHSGGLHKRCIKGFIEFISSYLGMTNKNRSAMPGFFLSAVPLFDCEKPGIYHILFALATFQAEIRNALLAVATQCYVLRNDKSAENDTAQSRYQKNQIVFQVLLGNY